MSGPDAVVVGAGVNGLVAANLVADAGWSVVVLEQQPTPVGAVRTDEEVADGFRHDTFSAFYPFAAASPVLAALDLEHWGLRWRHAPAVLGNPLPSGSCRCSRATRTPMPSGSTEPTRATAPPGSRWCGSGTRWDRAW